MPFTHAQTLKIYEAAIAKNIPTWKKTLVETPEYTGYTAIKHKDFVYLVEVHTVENDKDALPQLTLDNLFPWMEKFCTNSLYDRATECYFTDPQELCNMICEEITK